VWRAFSDPGLAQSPLASSPGSSQWPIWVLELPVPPLPPDNYPRSNSSFLPKEKKR